MTGREQSLTFKINLPPYRKKAPPLLRLSFFSGQFTHQLVQLSEDNTLVKLKLTVFLRLAESAMRL